MTEYHNRFLNKVIECTENGAFLPTWNSLPDVISKFTRSEYVAMTDFITSVMGAVTDKLKTETEFKDVQIEWRQCTFVFYKDSSTNQGCLLCRLFQVFEDIEDHLYDGIYECKGDSTLEHQVWLKNKLTAYDVLVNRYFDTMLHTLNFIKYCEAKYGPGSY